MNKKIDEENNELTTILNKKMNLSKFINYLESKLKNTELLLQITKNNENILDKFDNSNNLEKEIQGLLNKGDGEDLLEKYDNIKTTNLNIIYDVYRIIGESINAIKVYVKARNESLDDISDRFSNNQTCVTVRNQDDNSKTFGKFERVYWTNTSFADLYCGEGVKCDKKLPLTRSIRDTVSVGYKSNIFFTYSYNNNNNNYNIYINKNIAISFATLSTIGFAFIFKNLFLQ